MELMEKSTTNPTTTNNSITLAQEMAQAIKAAYQPKILKQIFEITPQAIWQWKVIPPRQAIRLEKATHGQYSRELIRPDLQWRCPKCRALIEDGYIQKLS